MRYPSIIPAAIVTAIVWCASAANAGALPRLRCDGARLVDPKGNCVILRGCNLGNWLLIEPWMLAIDKSTVHDQHELLSILASRFGDEKTEALMDLYRANWITPREFEYVKSFGFNVVRLPFHHSLLANDDTPFELRSDAFEWLDKAIDMAEQAGVYVILDMHGLPGGQSSDMTTGRVGENRLWKSKENQKRTAWLWTKIAERYKNRDAVAAYDLVNEPWGDYEEDIRPRLATLVGRLHDAIRKVDPDKLIFAAGSLRGASFYGDPAKRGWRNVGLTEHFYPGLFGNGEPSLETHARFLGSIVPSRAGLVAALNVPYLVGEFNVVFEHVGRPEMMRRYYDAFAADGWHATMWSLRLINAQGGVRPSNWYLITNKEPFRLPDFRKASYEGIERAFRELGTMPLVADEALRSALTTDHPKPLILATMPTPPEPSAGESLPGWTSTDISTGSQGVTLARPMGGVTLCGSGTDVWGLHDEFRYLHRRAEPDFAFDAWLVDFDGPHHYAKAGWMLRDGLEPDAAYVLINAFPDGRIKLAWREKRGELTHEKTLGISRLPIGMGIERKNGKVSVSYTDADGRWNVQQVSAFGGIERLGLIGLMASAHDDTAYATAMFRSLDESARSNSPPACPEPTNLLKNGSFEVVKDAANASDQAMNWDRWGHWFNRQDDWSPTRDGNSLLAYHHWQIEEAKNSGTYQDVAGLSAGKRYRFSVFANRDMPAEGKNGATSVELRIESSVGGERYTVASRVYPVGDIATKEGWSYLHLDGTLPTDSARVLIIVNPSGDSPRDAAVKFDVASLCGLSQSQLH